MNDQPANHSIPDNPGDVSRSVLPVLPDRSALEATLNAQSLGSRPRIACYLRISHADQSHESQKADVLAWLERSGIPLDAVSWIVDTISGREHDRPGLNALLEQVTSGIITTVVVQRLDRLSRSMLDGLQVLRRLIDAECRVVSVRQQIDLTGTMGRMISALLLGVAEMEWEVRRERTTAGIAVAKAAGRFKGRKPGTYKVDPWRVRDLRDKGIGPKEIADYLRVSRRVVTKYLALTREGGLLHTSRTRAREKSKEFTPTAQS